MKKNILLATTLLTAPFLMSENVWAQCVTTQSCTSLGYSATSNTGNCLKCPFGDYWACPASTTTTCDASYQYTCSGSGYSGGSGTACGGKYKSCTCASGYSWSSGSCVYTDTSSGGDSGSNGGSCTPIPNETGCECGTTTSSNGCGGTRYVCTSCSRRLVHTCSSVGCTSFSSGGKTYYHGVAYCTDTCYEGSKTVYSRSTSQAYGAASELTYEACMSRFSDTPGDGVPWTNETEGGC